MLVDNRLLSEKLATLADWQNLSRVIGVGLTQIGRRDTLLVWEEYIHQRYEGRKRTIHWLFQPEVYPGAG
jgi:hypothetical protein